MKFLRFLSCFWAFLATAGAGDESGGDAGADEGAEGAEEQGTEDDGDAEGDEGEDDAGKNVFGNDPDEDIFDEDGNPTDAGKKPVTKAKSKDGADGDDGDDDDEDESEEDESDDDDADEDEDEEGADDEDEDSEADDDALDMRAEVAEGRAVRNMKTLRESGEYLGLPALNMDLTKSGLRAEARARAVQLMEADGDDEAAGQDASYEIGLDAGIQLLTKYHHEYVVPAMNRMLSHQRVAAGEKRLAELDATYEPLTDKAKDKMVAKYRELVKEHGDQDLVAAAVPLPELAKLAKVRLVKRKGGKGGKAGAKPSKKAKAAASKKSARRAKDEALGASASPGGSKSRSSGSKQKPGRLEVSEDREIIESQEPFFRVL